MMENSNLFKKEDVERFMELALKEASTANEKNEVPVGCVFVD